MICNFIRACLQAELAPQNKDGTSIYIELREFKHSSCTSDRYPQVREAKGRRETLALQLIARAHRWQGRERTRSTPTTSSFLPSSLASNATLAPTPQPQDSCSTNSNLGWTGQGAQCMVSLGWEGDAVSQSALHICSPSSPVKMARALSPAVEWQAPPRWKGNASCVVRSDSHTTEPLDSPEKYLFLSPPQLICPTHTCVHPTLIHHDWGWLLFNDAMRTVGKTEVSGEGGEPASPVPGRLAAGFSARQRGSSLQGRPVQEPLGRLEAQLYHMPLCNLWQVP